MLKLSDNLKLLLKEAKLSENELARRTAIPQQIINRILSGQNLNPKIATLAPLAKYFSISISQLIGDELSSQSIKLSTNHSGWRDAPLIEWDKLGKTKLQDLIFQSKNKIAVDLDVSSSVFATVMGDNSMEPKFSIDTILIFDSKKTIFDKDFALIYTPEHHVELRQIFIKKGKVYKKCLNPKCAGYKATLIDPKSIYLGVLIQSRTNYLTEKD